MANFVGTPGNNFLDDSGTIETQLFTANTGRTQAVWRDATVTVPADGWL